MEMKFYTAIAKCVCEIRKNYGDEKEIWLDKLSKLINSQFSNETTFYTHLSSDNVLAFSMSIKHEDMRYTTHEIRIISTFAGLKIKIDGEDINNIKNKIHNHLFQLKDILVEI